MLKHAYLADTQGVLGHSGVPRQRRDAMDGALFIVDLKAFIREARRAAARRAARRAAARRAARRAVARRAVRRVVVRRVVVRRVVIRRVVVRRAVVGLFLRRLLLLKRPAIALSSRLGKAVVSLYSRLGKVVIALYDRIPIGGILLVVGLR